MITLDAGGHDFAVATVPPPAGRLSASLTFARRTVLKLRHVPEQLTDVIAIPIIFTVMFTYLFGGAMAGSTSEYLQFILPGTLVMTVVLVTMYTGVTLNTDVTKGVYDRFRTLPIWRPAALVGSLIGDAVRYLIASTIVVTLGYALGFRPDGGPGGVALAVGLVIVFALSLSWLWIVLGLVLRTPSSVMSVGLLIQFPLTLASNVFVEPDTMPSWLRAFVVDVNPVSRVVTATRGLMDGTATAAQLGWVFATCAFLLAVFVPLTLRRYRDFH